MKKAIEFLRLKGFLVTDKGEIITPLPEGEEGISLVDELEEVTDGNIFCYTIIQDKIEKKYS